MSNIILLLHYCNYKNALNFYAFYSLSEKKKKSCNITKIPTLKRITTVLKYNVWNMPV